MQNLLEKIQNPNCLGDQFHNETIDNLFCGMTVTFNNEMPFKNNVIVALSNYLATSNQHWLHMVINKSDIGRLNVIMRTKNRGTYVKRLCSLVYHLKIDTHYGKLFNKELIDELEKLIKNN